MSCKVNLASSASLLQTLLHNNLRFAPNPYSYSPFLPTNEVSIMLDVTLAPPKNLNKKLANQKMAIRLFLLGIYLSKLPNQYLSTVLPHTNPSHMTTLIWISVLEGFGCEIKVTSKAKSHST
jgi:hypothetical protein